METIYIYIYIYIDMSQMIPKISTILHFQFNHHILPVNPFNYLKSQKMDPIGSTIGHKQTNKQTNNNVLTHMNNFT